MKFDRSIVQKVYLNKTKKCKTVTRRYDKHESLLRATSGLAVAGLMPYRWTRDRSCLTMRAMRRRHRDDGHPYLKAARDRNFSDNGPDPASVW